MMGPWNPWLHDPAIGKAIWDLTLAMTANASLPDNVRQVKLFSSSAHGLMPYLRNLCPYRGCRAGRDEARASGGAGRRPEAE